MGKGNNSQRNDKKTKKPKEVVAPKMSAAQEQFLTGLNRTLAPDDQLGWVCPLPIG